MRVASMSAGISLLSGASGVRPRIFVSQETAGANGRLRIDANQTLERIRVNTDGIATISQNGNRLVELGTLFMMPAGKTDIKDNKMLIHGGVDSTLGAWNGTAYDGLTGQVARPGAYPYTAGLTVEKAIALAGGLTRIASERGIYRLHEDAPAAERRRVKMDDPVLPGDTLVVEESLF